MINPDHCYDMEDAYGPRPTWPDVLRQACEVAGLEHRAKLRLFRVSEHLFVGIDHPMLPAYVAELLAAQCRCGIDNPANTDKPWLEKAFHQYLHELWGVTPEVCDARTRILAALVALGKLTLEQAREVE